MFKSCCARPSKKINKTKSKSMDIDPLTNKKQENLKVNVIDKIDSKMSSEKETIPESTISDLPHPESEMEIMKKSSDRETIPELIISDISRTDTDTEKSSDKEANPEFTISDVPQTETDMENSDKTNDIDIPNGISVEKSTDKHEDNNTEEDSEVESTDDVFTKPDFAKKRFSVDYKKSRINFKRYSVDCSRNVATLEELANLEQELARTNVDVRIGRRKSTGILKSTSDSGEIGDKCPKVTQECCSDDDEVFEKDISVNDTEGPREPPATPVGRDELALRRHRFFSDLVCAAKAAVEHRVRFDPLGPMVADSGSEVEATAAAQSPAGDLEALIERLERVTSRLERLPLLAAASPVLPASPAPSPAASTPTPLTLAFIETDDMSINGYQDLMQGPLQTYLQLSKQIGGDINTHANLVNDAFQQQFRYIQLATSRSKPSQAEEVQLLAPTSEKISSIQQYREKNRASPFFNHLSAISESIPALGWVAVSPTPAPYVKEMNDAGQFYTNRVLKEWKEKDKTHVEWCKAWVQLLSDLQAYVKQYHTTGLVWSGKGAGAPPPPPPGGMPPPPPALPDIDFANMPADDRSALFAEINKGEAITSSLRKVTSDMQTHKNPQLRQGPAPFKATATSKVPTKALPTPGAGTLPDKPPVFARDGKKWIIEYQKGNPNLVVENAEMNNVVYMFRCRDSALTVRGKINGVVLDSCTKCAVVFDNLVSSVEFVNCQSVQMQVLGKVPTISIDKTDGCQIYLSQESLDVEIVSSKSSEMNVLVPKGNGDYTEQPIPEQFKTVLNKSSGLITTPVESKG